MNKSINLDKLNKSKWQSFTFDQIATKIAETVQPSEADVDIYVGLEHIDRSDIHIRRRGKPSQVKGGKLRCYPGDVIFGKRRAYQRKAAIVDFEGICSAHAFVFRAIPEVIDPRLFPFFLHSDQFMHRMIDISVGGLSPTINWSDLKHQKFFLPKKDQQAEIAKLLWNMDDLIVSDRSLLEKIAVNDLAQLKFFFSNIDISNAMRMRDIITIQKGKKPSKLVNSDDLNEDNREYGYKYLDAKYLRSKELSHRVPSNSGSKLVHIKDEDIIILWDGDVGDVFTGENGILCSTMAKILIKEKNILPKYLFNFLRFASTEIKRCAVGTTIKHVDPDVFSKLLIPKISLEEQSKIVKSFHTNHVANLALENRLDLNKALNQTIINKVFTSAF